MKIVSLAPEVIQGEINMNKLIRGDEVIVFLEKTKETGVIDKVISDTFIIKGVNLSKKHQKPNPNKGVAGGIVQIELPIHKSNIAIYNKSKKKIKSLFKKTKTEIKQDCIVLATKRFSKTMEKNQLSTKCAATKITKVFKNEISPKLVKDNKYVSPYASPKNFKDCFEYGSRSSC